MHECYFCGGSVQSNDHIPPKNLFPEGMREQLITVPSCKIHNEGFHMLDDRIKIYLQSLSNSNLANFIFEHKTSKALKRIESQNFLTNLLGEFKTYGKDNYELVVKSKHIDLYFERITKGLYYFHSKEIAKGRVKCILSHDLDNQRAYIETLTLFKYKESNGVFRKGNGFNEEIFKYYYGYDSPFFYLKMLFYKDVSALSILKLES